MSQAGTIDNGLNPREVLRIQGDTGIATFTGGQVKIYAGTVGKGAGSTVSFNNDLSTSTFNLTDAFSNTILGDGAGSTSMTGSLNVGVGVNSMINMTTGSNNTSLGTYSLNHLTTGINNTSIGDNTHYDLITGRNNIALGISAGQNYDGSESYNIDIGSSGESGVSHTTTIGFTSALSGQTRCFIGGIVGNTISGAQTVVIDPLTDQLGVITGGSPAIETITGNDGIARSPSSNNFNILGTGSITTVGSASTETIQLTGLTLNAIQVGAGTATLTQLGPVNRAVLTSSATGVPAMTALATNGQLIIGSTAGAPAAGSITGTAIEVTNGSNSIALSVTGGGLTWNNVTGTSQTVFARNGYIANNAGLITFTMNSTNIGDVSRIVGHGAGGWTLLPTGSQIFYFGNAATTVTTGSLSSTNLGDCVELVALSATVIIVISSIGNITVV